MTRDDPEKTAEEWIDATNKDVDQKNHLTDFVRQLKSTANPDFIRQLKSHAKRKARNQDVDPVELAVAESVVHFATAHAMAERMRMRRHSTPVNASFQKINAFVKQTEKRLDKLANYLDGKSKDSSGDKVIAASAAYLLRTQGTDIKAEAQRLREFAKELTNLTAATESAKSIAYDKGFNLNKKGRAASKEVKQKRAVAHRVIHLMEEFGCKLKFGTLHKLFDDAYPLFSPNPLRAYKRTNKKSGAPQEVVENGKAVCQYALREYLNEKEKKKRKVAKSTRSPRKVTNRVKSGVKKRAAH